MALFTPCYKKPLGGSPNLDFSHLEGGLEQFLRLVAMHVHTHTHCYLARQTAFAQFFGAPIKYLPLSGNRRNSSPKVLVKAGASKWQPLVQLFRKVFKTSWPLHST